MPSNSPRRPVSMYIDTASLSALVTEYRRTRSTADDLAKALLAIAGGVWERYRFTIDKDDFCQEVVLHLLQRPLEKADVQKHLFNYFTTCSIRFGMKMRDKAYGDRRRFETYAAELVESGRQIPQRLETLDLAEWSDDVDPKGWVESDNGGGLQGSGGRPPRAT